MPEELRILFVTPEAHPLIKTGGLGDVAGALPPALRDSGIDARLLLPAYPGLINRLEAQPVTGQLQVLPDMLPVQIFHGLMPDSETPVYLIDAPALYHRTGPYVDEHGRDWPDNALRFGVLSRTAALFAEPDNPFGWLPRLIHCNDWQTGLTPAYLANRSERRTRTLLTLHNMAFQGSFPPRVLPYLDLPKASFSVQGLEFHGQISFLKAGLYYADHITTVSPTYADEIQTPEFGYGLEGLVSLRRGELSGILNGVDTGQWNPSNDPYLPAGFSNLRLQGKVENKAALQQRIGLEPKPSLPLLGIVSRLTPQKGIDLVLEIADRLLAQPLQLAVLGSGSEALETGLRALQQRHPGKVAVRIGYDEELAHQIEGGADIFLMPSRFEPCGLNQMYSMLYGTPPVVRATGGLADSVVDATPLTLADGSATGFAFTGANADELLACVYRALILFENKKAWRKVQLTGMKRDFSWQRSAQRYAELYRALVTSD